MDYVAQLAASHDTVGTERQFQTTSGRTVSVYGSAYGWKIDQDAEVAQLTQEIQSGTQTTREPVYSMTANSYGVNDLGNTYIEVDLTEQYMRYYQDGSVIFESDIVSGLASDPERKTPPGIFTLAVSTCHRIRQENFTILFSTMFRLSVSIDRTHIKRIFG